MISGDTLTAVAASLAAVVSFTILVGIAVRFILMPYLRENLVRPVQETHVAVTENGGKNDPPTVPDKLHELQTSVDDLHATVTTLASDIADARRDATAAVDAARKQARENDLAQTVLLEHIKGHTHEKPEDQ